MQSVQYSPEILYVILYFFVLHIYVIRFAFNLCSEVFEVLSQEAKTNEMLLFEAYLSTLD